MKMRPTSGSRFSNNVISGDEAKKATVSELTAFFDDFFSGADQKKIVTQAEVNDAIGRVTASIDEKFGASVRIAEAVQSSLRTFFAKLFGGKHEVMLAPAQVGGHIATAGADVSKAVEALHTSMRPGAAATFDEAAAAAIDRLKKSGNWVPEFDRLGLLSLFAAAAKSSGMIPFGEGSATRTKSALGALEAFFSWLGATHPRENLRLAALSALGEPKASNRGIPIDPASAIFCRAADERARQKKICFGEAMRELVSEGFTVRDDGSTAFEVRANIVPGSRLAVDTTSASFAELARKRSLDRGIDYGQAMKELRAEGFRSQE